MELYQTKKLLHSKGNNQQNKETIYASENIFANHTSNERLIPKSCKETPTIQKQENNCFDLKNGQRT